DDRGLDEALDENGMGGGEFGAVEVDLEGEDVGERHRRRIEMALVDVEVGKQRQVPRPLAGDPRAAERRAVEKAANEAAQVRQLAAETDRRGGGEDGAGDLAER